MPFKKRDTGIVNLSQKTNLKYLIYAVICNSLIILPYAYFDALSNSATELTFAISFILCTVFLSVYVYRSKREKYKNQIFIGLFSILWILFFIHIDKGNISIIFFLIYPPVTMTLLNYRKALTVNIIMLLIYSFFISYDMTTGSFVKIDPIALRTGSVFLMTLITSFFWKKNSANTLEHMNSLALYDSLTGVANKKHFDLYIENLIGSSKRKNEKFSLLFIDIDNFKKINDNPGHEVGNKVLIDVADRINECLNITDYLFRIGGDEFIAVLPEMSDDFSPAIMAGKIQSADDPGLHLPSLSIGIANYPEDGTTRNELVQKAENAMYRAKKNGKNTFSFFHNEFNKQVKKRLRIEKNLRSADLDNEFSLVFQPKIQSAGKKIIGAEALVRWNCPGLGDVPPSEFISIAEDSDIIHKISTWVYRKAFTALKRMQENGFPGLILSVNVSPLQISKNTLINSLNTAISESGISPEFIELEITEGMLLNSEGYSNETLSYLRQKGFRISIDDFGTGYSSLSYLQKLNLDSLKIDRSFISEIEENNVYSITKAIISLAKSMELQTVAEGVETRTQLLILNEMGCDLIQGFYYSKPLEEDEFLKLKSEMIIC